MKGGKGKMMRFIGKDKTDNQYVSFNVVNAYADAHNNKVKLIVLGSDEVCVSHGVVQSEIVTEAITIPYREDVLVDLVVKGYCDGRDIEFEWEQIEEEN